MFKWVLVFVVQRPTLCNYRASTPTEEQSNTKIIIPTLFVQDHFNGNNLYNTRFEYTHLYLLYKCFTRLTKYILLFPSER